MNSSKKFTAFFLVISLLIPSLHGGGVAASAQSFKDVQRFVADYKWYLLTAGIAATAFFLQHSRVRQAPRDNELIEHGADLIDKVAIDAYLKGPYHTCPSLNSLSGQDFGTTDYRDFIQPGARTVLALMKDEYLFDTLAYQDDAQRISGLKDILDVCWFLYSLALAKGDEFGRGAMVVHDDGKIYNYFIQYVKQVDADGWYKDPVIVSQNPYAYCRVSTHLKDVQKNKFLQHGYGIDIRFDKDSVPLLPAGKRHLLFTRIDEQRTFIKFEDHGLYWRDGWVPHVSDALWIIAKRCVGVKEHSQPEMMRKESFIPREILQMAQLEGITAKRLSDIYAQSHEDGDLRKLLRARYPLDIETRMGNEVILDAADLQCVKYYAEDCTPQEKLTISLQLRQKKLITQNARALEFDSIGLRENLEKL